MLGYFVNAFVAVRSAHGALLQRARTERGASMVEYALLVGLIAVVAVVAVSFLGNGISGLFSNANTCVGGLNSTAC
jgi:pilus assembly protein Flp/PilA